ncbi:MAG: hypothetical protein ACMXYK_03895 [Candidatus Woesearchaeota archaeon]
MGEPNPERIPEKIHETKVEKEKGYLYYVDEDGDVARVPAKWNKDPRFIEKVAEEDVPEGVEIQDAPHIMFDSSKKGEGKHVYEDAITIGDFSKHSLVTGHFDVVAKGNRLLKAYPEEALAHLFTVASMSASMLFEGLSATGTNIILNQDETLIVSVVPRFNDDGLGLFWEMKQGDQNKVKAMCEKIKDALVIGDVKDFSKVSLDETQPEVLDEKPSGDVPKKKVNIVDPTPEAEVQEPKNYMYDHIRRIP